jgi:hypothetical protein
MEISSKEKYSVIMKYKDFRNMDICGQASPEWMDDSKISITRKEILLEMLCRTYGFYSELHPYFTKSQWKQAIFETHEIAVPTIHPICKYYVESPDGLFECIKDTVLLIEPTKPKEVRSSSRMSDEILNVYDRISDGEYRPWAK